MNLTYVYNKYTYSFKIQQTDGQLSGKDRRLQVLGSNPRAYTFLDVNTPVLTSPKPKTGPKFLTGPDRFYMKTEKNFRCGPVCWFKLTPLEITLT